MAQLREGARGKGALYSEARTAMRRFVRADHRHAFAEPRQGALRVELLGELAPANRSRMRGVRGEEISVAENLRTLRVGGDDPGV